MSADARVRFVAENIAALGGGQAAALVEQCEQSKQLLAFLDDLRYATL